nr:MAG TPA: neurotoxin [Caudoviricetes sp.]
MSRHDGYDVRGASLSSLSVISCGSGRASLWTVNE